MAEIETNELQLKLDKIYGLKTSNPTEYEKQLIELLIWKCESTDENLNVKEKVFYDLSEFYSKINQPLKIQMLLEKYKFVLDDFPKAKAAKVIKNLIEYVQKIENTTQLQVDMCLMLIEWCKVEKRTYLRNRIEIKLSQLYLILNKYQQALELIDALLEEVRKADDKHLLVECQLIDSKLQYALKNHAKAKASLTASRACANSIYCQPTLQADIDSMSGILHSEDNDYKTAYSYFYESFEAFNTADDSRALSALKYMIMCKIMTNNNEEIQLILNGKYGLKYAGIDLDAMRAVMKANKNKSLNEFRDVQKKYEKQISGDPIIRAQLNQLYENLLEQNLYRIVEPYNRVQIDHIAKKINLDQMTVQKKLSEMILDKKVVGTLDQGNGCLILFEELQSDDLYKNSLTLIKNMNGVVDKLFDKAKLMKN